MVKLVFLHGIGHGKNAAGLRAVVGEISDALSRLGYPSLDPEIIISPWYGALLDEPIEWACPAPARTFKRLARDDHDRQRLEYARRQGSLERLLEEDSSDGDLLALPNAIPNWAAGAVANLLAQARRYLRDEKLRNCVLQVVLSEIPRDGEIVIVGHSLGSLIAIDVLGHLPPRLTVRRLVTLGSPAGHPALHSKGERLLKDFPLPRVGSWVNFLSALDPVPFSRGIAQLFPHALDWRLKIREFNPHAATHYLSSRSVARAVGEGMYGSLSTELAAGTTTTERPLDENESKFVAALEHGHLLSAELAGDPERLRRFNEALAEIQRTAIARLVHAYRAEARPMPSRLLILGDGQRPKDGVILGFDASIGALLAMAAGNPVAPFEIAVSAKRRRNAIERLAQFLGFPRSHGEAVFASLDEARNVVTPRSRASTKIALAAIGGSMLVAAPLGLMIAAPAGLYGAAAITSALAAFGPGGIVGGMLTAGALLGAGGTTVGAALASPSSSVEAVEGAVAEQLALAIARGALKAARDDGPWFVLCELEMQINRLLRHLEPYSDPKSKNVQVLNRKAAAVRAAISCMVERRLISALVVGERQS